MLEQIKMLEASARTYMALAKAMQRSGNTEQMKMYAAQGRKACVMVLEFKRTWDLDSTNILEFKIAN